MSVTLKEQETIILYNNGELEAEIYTYDPKLKRKIEQAEQRRPDLYRVIHRGSDGAVRCVFPKKWLTVILREPISEERRQVLSSGMKKRNAARES